MREAGPNATLPLALPMRRPNARLAVACLECGAQYPDPSGGCAQRFDALLALDHSHREPWGSRHALAFSCFALQHPSRFPGAARDRAYDMLRRVYREGVALSAVVREVRRSQARGGSAVATPPSATAVSERPSTPPHPAHPHFRVTIQDLGAFNDAAYAVGLDAWCRATLHALAAAE